MNIIENISCLERYNNLGSMEKIQMRALRLDVTKRIVAVNNEEIELTNMEFEILSLLANNSGRVFSKVKIYNLVWKEPYYGDYNVVMSHIHNIREKIEDNPREPV